MHMWNSYKHENSKGGQNEIYMSFCTEEWEVGNSQGDEKG